MNIEESIQQIKTLIEAWQLDEADLNQTDINAMQVLLKENQELKKQLSSNTLELEKNKTGYIRSLNNQLSENIEPDPEDFYLAEIEEKANNYDILLIQQKEFIKYLEDETSKWHTNYDSYNYEYEIEEPTAEELVNEILQKCKEIIGGE